MNVTKVAPPVSLPNVIIELTPSEAGRLLDSLYIAGSRTGHAIPIGDDGGRLSLTLEALGYTRSQ